MVLRTKFTDGYEVNTDLGPEYHWIDKETCKDKFDETAVLHFGKEDKHFTPDTYGFIVFDKGREVMPLYKEHENLILNDSGGLFRNLCFGPH